MDIISSEQLRKLKKIKPFGHSEASKKKIQTDFAHFSRPGENDPYVDGGHDEEDAAGEGKEDDHHQDDHHQDDVD